MKSIIGLFTGVKRLGKLNPLRLTSKALCGECKQKPVYKQGLCLECYSEFFKKKED